MRNSMMGWRVAGGHWPSEFVAEGIEGSSWFSALEFRRMTHRANAVLGNTQGDPKGFEG